MRLLVTHSSGTADLDQLLETSLIVAFYRMDGSLTLSPMVPTIENGKIFSDGFFFELFGALSQLKCTQFLHRCFLSVKHATTTAEYLLKR